MVTALSLHCMILSNRAQLVAVSLNMNSAGKNEAINLSEAVTPALFAVKRHIRQRSINVTVTSLN